MRPSFSRRWDAVFDSPLGEEMREIVLSWYATRTASSWRWKGRSGRSSVVRRAPFSQPSSSVFWERRVHAR